MNVVLDTSILFQALYSSQGASHAVLKLIRSGDLKLALSIPVFEEYCDVLLRTSSLKQFDLLHEDVQRILDFIALIGLKTDIHYLLRPNLRDDSDNIFMELAFASDSRFIITKNIKDFTYRPELKLEEIQIVSSSEFLKKWREQYA